MKLKIRLISDLCSYSGETYNSYIDSDVVYDEYGFPYIPAKRVKGCIREAALELVEFGLYEKADYVSLFGKSGNDRTLFTLDNAYPTQYKDMIQDVIDCDDKVLTHPQKILRLYTYTRSQTAMEDGIAQENSLRTMRVVKRNTEFEADLQVLANASKKQIDMLTQAVSMVKHMGMVRTRGFGQVEMTLMNSKEADKNSYICLAKEPSDHSQVKMNYSITLDSAVICKSEVGNEGVSQEYISGNKVLGMLIEKMGQDCYQSLISSGSIKVSNAYITHGSERCTPISRSIQKVKDTNYAEIKGTGYKALSVYDLLWEYNGDEQLASVGNVYVSSSGYVESVETQISYHHRRPNDKGKGRATGKDDSAFYQLGSLCRGQTFKGFVIADYAIAQKLVSVIPNGMSARIGYAKGTEYGSVSFHWQDMEFPNNNKENLRSEFVIKLNAPLILYNEAGCAETSYECVEKYLSKELMNNTIKYKNMCAAYTTVGGYNVTWNAPKPMIPAFAEGTVFVFTGEMVDVSALKNAFLGERTGEGFGEIELYENRSLSLALKKTSACKGLEKQAGNGKTALLGRLRVQEEIFRLKELGRSLAKDMVLTAKLTKIKEIDSCIGKLILIYRGEKSMEAMNEQIAGIETDSKRELAVKIMKPVTEVVSDVNPLLSSEEVYRVVTESYLSQIKYEVRPAKKERRG